MSKTENVSDIIDDENVTDSLQRLEEREQRLHEKLERLKSLEEEILAKEKAVKAKEKSLKEQEKAKKQILLRLSPSLWEELAAWAEEDFRSINSQIEYLLSASVRERKKK